MKQRMTRDINLGLKQINGYDFYYGVVDTDGFIHQFGTKNHCKKYMALRGKK